MKNIRLFGFALILITLSQSVFAQEFIDKWEATYTATGNIEIIKTLSDDQNNVYILANQINSGTSEVVLMKYDQAGDRDWLRSYDYSSTSEDYGVDMVSDDSDNIYILVSVNPQNAQNFSDNGYAIRKYSSSGTLINSYQSIGGFLGDIPSIIGYSSSDKVFVTSSRYKNSNMGLNLSLRRLSNTLTFEALESYDSSEDDVPYALGFGSTIVVYFTKGFNTMSRMNINAAFSSGDGFSSAVDMDISSTPFTSIKRKGDITILKYATGTKLFFRLLTVPLETYDNTYQIEDVFLDVSQAGSYPSNIQSLSVTGSQTSNGEEKMFMQYFDENSNVNASSPNWVLQYTKSLNVTHDGVKSTGLVATKNEAYGRLVQRNSGVSRTYAGFATFENSNDQDVEYHSQSADFEATHLELLSNGQVYVGASGSTLELFALCNPPNITLVGANQVIEEGESLTITNGQSVDLSINNQGSSSILWSTGETDATQISVTGVSETKTISVTVTDESGCSSDAEVDIKFANPAPVKPIWLHPTIENVNGGTVTYGLSWSNDDPLTASYDISAGYPELGSDFTATVSTTNKSIPVERDGSLDISFNAFAVNDDDISSNPSLALSFNSCNDHTIAELEAFLNATSIIGTSSLNEAGESGLLYRIDATVADPEYYSFYEWTLPVGWELTEYRGASILVTTPANANSGQVSVRIVNPCTSETTTAITKDVFVIKDQTITFNQPTDLQVGDDAIGLGATASSSLVVSYSLSNANAELSGSMLTAKHAGDVTITASQDGNEEYNASPDVERTITISKGDDAITFNALSDVVWDVANFDLDADASSKSGRQITWVGSDPSIATVSSTGVVNPIKPGTITITASLPGNDDWNAADDVQRTLTILKVGQIITFNSLPTDKEEGDQSFNLGAYASTSSGLMLSYQSNNTNAVTISNGQIQIVGAGTAIITASQSGNDFYSAAGDAQQSITVAEGLYIWEGGIWNFGESVSPSFDPSTDDNVEIRENYAFSIQGSFEAKNLTITASGSVSVNSQSTLEVTSDLNNNGSLTIQSGSSLITYFGNNVSDNIHFKRNTRYSDGRYSFVGSPVEQDVTITGDDLGSFVYKFDEVELVGNEWADASTDELVPGKGYTQAGQQEIIFTGVPNSGTITYSGTYTADNSETNEGWNLIANPYPAAINVEAFISANDNTTGPVYIWDDNGSDMQRGTSVDYIVANGVAATNTTPAGGQTRYNRHLGSSQGFFVKLNDNTDTDIIFTESMRVSGSNSDDNFFRTEETPIARINLTNEDGLFKQTILAIKEDASTEILNKNYDAPAFSASADYGLFTIKAGRSLAINTLPTNWEQTQLQLNLAVAGSYMLTTELENYEGNLYLWDKQTNETIDLKQDESYAFNTQSGIDVDRFVLLTAPNEVLNVEQADNLVFATNKTLHIRQAEEVQRTYEVYNLKGQLELTTEMKGNQNIDVSHLATGIYLVFDGAQTHKIILK